MQHLYNPNTDTWEDNVVLATDAPNTGEVPVTVPDFQNIDQNSMRVALMKVSLNGSRNGNSRRKRVIPALALGAIGRSALRFLMKKTITDIGKRLLCNAWHSGTRGINRNRLPPCPCNLEQMSIDDRYTKEKPFQFYTSKYFFRKFKATSCYRQTNARYVYYSA